MLYSQAKNRFIDSLITLDRSSETIKGYKKELKYFGRFLTDRYNCEVYVEDITQENLEKYLLHLKRKGLKPASRSRALYVMRSFFKYLHSSGIVAKNPAALIGNIKVQQKEREYLTEDEVMELINAIDHKIIKAAVTFLYYTGLRISEMSNLKLSDVDIDEGIVRVVAGKGNKDRIVPINEKLKKILINYLESIRPRVDSQNFFATKKTGMLSPQYVNRQIKEAVKNLGWKKRVSAHVLRHSYATALIKKDVNIVNVSKLLGHSSVKVTSVYTHTSIDDLKQAVAEL